MGAWMLTRFSSSSDLVFAEKEQFVNPPILSGSAPANFWKKRPTCAPGPLRFCCYLHTLPLVSDKKYYSRSLSGSMTTIQRLPPRWLNLSSWYPIMMIPILSYPVVRNFIFRVLSVFGAYNSHRIFCNLNTTKATLSRNMRNLPIGSTGAIGCLTRFFEKE